jgi:hypothetical protein
MFTLHRMGAFMKLRFHRDRAEAELDDEVREFYQTIVDRDVERGLPEQEARRRARLRFASPEHPEHVKEQVRDARAGAAIASLGRDVAYWLRTLHKTPVFTLVTILTVALGIAANATVFSIVSRLVLRPPPVGAPGTLMSLHTTHHGDQCCNSFSWPLFADVRERARSFSGMAGYSELVPASIGGTGEPERVWGQAVTANFFEVAQLGMTLGRGFARDEESAPAIVLGHRLWQNRFGGDPAIAGKTITLSGRPFTVIGVAPISFRSLDLILDCQFWVRWAISTRCFPRPATGFRDYIAG